MCAWLIAGMGLQAWVEMRSRELQTKEKGKVAEKGDPAGTSGPIEERTMVVAEPPVVGAAEPEEAEEAVQPLVRKKRRLEKNGQTVVVQMGGLGGDAEPSGGSREELERGPDREPVGIVPGEEVQAVMPLMVVPSEGTAEEGQWARDKQAAKVMRQEARDVAMDLLCAALSRLGRVEITKETTSRAAQSEGESSDGSRPYVP